MNGKVERKNITLTKLVVAIMLNYGVTPHWWREILLTVCYVLNIVPKSKIEISPYETLKKKIIDDNPSFRVFIQRIREK